MVESIIGTAQSNSNFKNDLADQIVISGLSGVFPDSRHVNDLAEILYNKKNPISSNPRWKYNHPEVAQFTGNVTDLDLFDAQFFKVHYKLGQTMDVISRKILEQAYQAIYDAGFSSEHFSGKKVGVYIGTCISESEKIFYYDASARTGLGMAGCSKAMFANRISYWLNAKGPSMSIDASCCSSTVALEQAYLAMSRNECEAAIVGGGKICLHPQSSIHCSRIMTTSVDGKTKSFDENASGFVISDAISVIFLQKAKDALRIYADVVHVKSGFTSRLDGVNGQTFGFYRNPVTMAHFLEKFYKEARVLPQAVEYVEAFGSGDFEADKSELELIDRAFCKNRTNELLVGSVMSNIGYCEAASGICAIVKVLLGYHTGILAPNLHYEKPRRDVKGLLDGHMRIVTENEKFHRSYAAINNLSFNGSNVHVLLHGHYKPKEISRYQCDIPYLVLISARQDTSVRKILEDLKSRQLDPEELALLHNIHEKKITGHLGRGYAILNTNEKHQTISLCDNTKYCDDAKRPLWFVYSGMGSQWVGMGTQLMRIPIFAASIERCRRVLEPKGVDIVNIITSVEKTVFDNILNSFVGIAAIQIGLTDILNELGLTPDKIIGHSTGELGCAYADGCLSAEEMILAAYHRGLVSLETTFIHGSMAAIGLGYQTVQNICPPEIVVACHNGPNSCTISGPSNKVQNFVAELSKKKVFAKEVPCSNIAYHSRYIAHAGPTLLRYLRQVIKSPKLRSKRWISTSVPQAKWSEPLAKTSSAEYHTNNLLSPVLFEEASQFIPSNAVLVEIAPHGLMQAILKRSLPNTCRHVALTRRGHHDNVRFLLEAIGNLFTEGYHPKVQALYPKINFPVSTGTPFLSHLVEWEHSERWSLPLYVSACRKEAASCKFVYSIHNIEHDFLKGNVLNGKNTFPFAAALVAAWDVLSMTAGVLKKHLSVKFRDVMLFSQPILHDRRQLHLHVNFQRGTGLFEILDENVKIATGYAISEKLDDTNLVEKITSIDHYELSSKDIYRILKNRGFGYHGEFQSIYRVNKSLTAAQIIWNNNWVTFVDSILQLCSLRHSHDFISEPVYIRQISINIEQHSSCDRVLKENKNIMTATVSEIDNVIRCGGVSIEDVKFRDLPPFYTDAKLLTLQFLPYFQKHDSNDYTALITYLQIVAENLNKPYINVLEISDNGINEIERIIYDFKNISEVKIRYQHMHVQEFLVKRPRTDLLLLSNLSTDDKLCQILYKILPSNSLLVNKEEFCERPSLQKPSALYQVISSRKCKHQHFELIRWRPTSTSVVTSTFIVRSPADLCSLSSTLAAISERHKLYIIITDPLTSALKELLKERQKKSQVNIVVMSDKNQDEGHIPDNNLILNVLKNGHWGGWYYAPYQQKISDSCNISLQCSRYGDFNSLKWVEISNTHQPGVKVNVHYAGINNIDTKNCACLLPRGVGKNTYGMDFSGVTDSGVRVMGLVNFGAASSRVAVDPKLLWPIPDYWSLEDAATVPFAYAITFYCLCIKYKLYPGMSILVHGGAAGMGQAAISIALENGCEVFTTVSDTYKKQLLCKLFPKLKEKNIGYSRDHTFSDMVLSATSGNGCNIVICCLKNDLKHLSIKCTKNFGIMFDLNLINMPEKFTFGMFNLENDRTYSTIDFRKVLSGGKSEDLKKLQLLMTEGIKRGFVKPLLRAVFSKCDASRAFKFVAASRHRGRTLLQIQAKPKDEVAPEIEPRLHCDFDSTQLILSNNDYFGIQIAKRLVKRGAKNIYLHGTNRSPIFEFEIRSLEKRGVRIKLADDILDNNDNINILVNKVNNLSPIEGIYVIKKDDNARSESFHTIRALHTAAKNWCANLRYFGVVTNEVYSSPHPWMIDSSPLTVMKLPELKKMEDGAISHSGAVYTTSVIDAFERALKLGEIVSITYEPKKQLRSVLEVIAYESGIKMLEDFDETTTLSELKLEQDKLAIINSYLRDTHNLYLSEEEVANFTLQRLKDIEHTNANLEYEETKGLTTFYSYIGSDELLAVAEMVFLPSLVNNSSMRDDEFDVSQTFICVIPGLDGQHGRFSTLCQGLKLPAVVLQPGFQQPYESINCLAHRYAEILLKKAAVKRKFYLMGYESGTLVTLEMAAILEDHGLSGTVFLVGESPDQFHVTLKKELQEYDNDEELQIAIALHISNIILGGDTNGLEGKLCKTNTWSEKIETSVRSILGRVSHSSQYIREVIDCAFGRIKQAQSYRLGKRVLRSKLVLMNAAGSAGSSSNCLQSYSQQPVEIYQLRAPLAHAATDLRCCDIINRHLDIELLTAFERKNICDTYLCNPKTYMSAEVSPDI